MMFFYLILFLHTIIKVDKTLILQQLWKMKELKRAMNISTFLFIPIFFFHKSFEWHLISSGSCQFVVVERRL